MDRRLRTFECLRKVLRSYRSIPNVTNPSSVLALCLAWGWFFVRHGCLPCLSGWTRLSHKWSRIEYGLTHTRGHTSLVILSNLLAHELPLTSLRYRIRHRSKSH